MRKLAIYGTGLRGMRASLYMAYNEVSFYIDNGNVKRKFFGKDVMTYKEFLSSYRDVDYHVILAIDDNENIRRELEDDGVDYEIFSELYIIAKKMTNDFRKIFGFAVYAEDLQSENFILRLMNSEHRNKLKYLVSHEASKDYKEKFGIKYRRLYDLEGIDCIINATGMNASINTLVFRKYYKTINLCSHLGFYISKDIYNNPYIGKKDWNEDEWNKTIKNDLVQRKTINKYVALCSDDICLEPSLIEIETTNKCNGTCSFCPVNQIIDKREKKFMSLSLFKKIIKDLQDMNYSGRLALFSNNEPLIDLRLPDLLSYARKKLGKAYLYLFTNGTLLDWELYENIIVNLDELVIDNYNQELQVLKNLREIADKIENMPNYRCKTTIVLRKPKDILTSRGGTAPNRKNMIIFNDDSCALPFQQMVIRPDGKVSLCCNDPMGKVTLGDVSRQSILEAWNSVQMKDIRRKIKNGRKAIQNCKYCDTFNLY